MIKVSCPCGNTFTVPDHKKEDVTPCPKCRRPIKPSVTSQFQFLEEEEDIHTATPLKAPNRAKAGKPAKSKSAAAGFRSLAKTAKTPQGGAQGGKPKPRETTTRSQAPRVNLAQTGKRVAASGAQKAAAATTKDSSPATSASPPAPTVAAPRRAGVSVGVFFFAVLLSLIIGYFWGTGDLQRWLANYSGSEPVSVAKRPQFPTEPNVVVVGTTRPLNPSGNDSTADVSSPNPSQATDSAATAGQQPSTSSSMPRTRYLNQKEEASEQLLAIKKWHHALLEERDGLEADLEGRNVSAQAREALQKGTEKEIEIAKVIQKAERSIGMGDAQRAIYIMEPYRRLGAASPPLPLLRQVRRTVKGKAYHSPSQQLVAARPHKHTRPYHPTTSSSSSGSTAAAASQINKQETSSAAPHGGPPGGTTSTNQQHPTQLSAGTNKTTKIPTKVRTGSTNRPATASRTSQRDVAAASTGTRLNRSAIRPITVSLSTIPWYSPLQQKMQRVRAVCKQAQPLLWGTGAAIFMGKINAYSNIIRLYPAEIGKLEAMLRQIRNHGADIHQLIAHKESNTLSLGTQEDLRALKKYLRTKKLQIDITKETIGLERILPPLRQEIRTGRVGKRNLRYLAKCLSQIIRKFNNAFEPVYSILTHFSMQLAHCPDARCQRK